MKNIKTVFSKLFAAALAGAFLAGCTNTFDVSQGASGDAAQPAGYVKVLLGNVDSRTIFPNEWNDEKKGNLKYYISGTGILSDGVNEKTLALTELDYAKITGTGQQIELTPGTWELILSAYQLPADAEPANSNMVLTAKNTGIDLTTSGATQTFALKPVATTQATGTVSITGSVNCGSYLKYIVHDVKTFNGTTYTSVSDGAYKVKVDVTSSTASSTSVNFSYTKDVTASSNYYYVVTFYNGDPDNGGQVLGEYPERLIVDGGNVSSKNIALADFLNSPADNPTQLSVETSFVNVGQAANAVVPNTFLATFSWGPDATNESGYELKIYKGTVEGDVTTYPAEANYKIKKGSVTIGTAAGEVATGSSAANTDPTFGKNETQAAVYLETGYTYKASIRAYNRYDELDDADTPTRVTKVNNVGGEDCVFGMFTVAYTLGDNNAFVKTGLAAPNEEDHSAMYVVGYNFNTEAQELMGYVASTASSTSYPYVTVGSATMKWIKWITTVAGMTSDQMDDPHVAPAVTSIAAGNITNLRLTGVWKSVTTVQVTYPSYDALKTTVWITSYKIGNDAPVNVTTSEYVPITGASTDDTIVFTYDDSIVSGVTAQVTNGRDGATVVVDAATKTVSFNASTIANAEGYWYLTISGTATYLDAGSTETRPVSQLFAINLN